MILPVELQIPIAAAAGAFLAVLLCPKKLLATIVSAPPVNSRFAEPGFAVLPDRVP